MDINIITLEDGEEYLIIDTIVNKNDKYLLLAQEKQRYDFSIRKIIKKEDKEYLIKLDNELEFEEIITLFNNKHIEEREENEE